MQDKLLQFKLQQVWTLVDLPYGKRAIGTKWVYRNKKDERGIVIRNKARLVAQGYTEEGIDYNEVFALIARIEAIRLFLAYASFKDFVVYSMDLKSAFLYGKIEEEIYVCKPPGFEDPKFPDRVYKVEKALYGLDQATRAWTTSDGIFISQDKYVNESLKKFSFSTVKTASTPIETSKPLMKDENNKDVDVHLYRSMIGSLMYLTSSRPDIMFIVCACARFQVTPKVSHLHVVKRIFRYLKDRKSTIGGCQFLESRLISWQCKKQTIVANSTTEAENLDPNSKKFLMYPKFLQLFFNNQIENLKAVLNDKYDTPSHTKKVFANMRRQGNDFSGTITPLFATMLIQPQAVEGKGSGQPTEPQHTPTTASPSNIDPIPIIASSSQPQKTHKRRKTKRPTEISQSSRPTTFVADETVYEEKGDNMKRAATTAASLDAEQDNGNIIRTESMVTLNKPIPQGTGSGSGPRRQDTIFGDRPAQTRFERLSKQSNDPPLSRVNTPGSGEDRLKIMELMEICIKLSDKSLDDQENASKQERNEEDEDISWFQEDAETQGSTAEPSTPPTTTTLIEDEDLIIAQTLMKMRSEKSKEKAKQRGSKEKSSEPATRPTRGVTMQEPSESGTKKAIKFDEEVAKILAEELEVELEEEKRVTIQRKEEANLISWDNTQAMMEADYELA
ncbi:retrovirus-related pol polyprotein from transposon TNT 1-94 [Tanacetum coccineum]